MEQLLTTKLYIPAARPALVARKRLIDQLNGCLHCKLTLVSAPAGFGKTTLVSQWVKSANLDPDNEPRFAWLSLDEGDNDPNRFLTYVIAALNHAGRAGTGFGAGVLSMLQSPQPSPPETILTALINEIDAVSTRIILVLDDLHLIENPAIHNAIAFLIEHQPLQLHLVIATRVDPQLPLSRLRVRSQMTELRAADLRFTPTEAAEFLNRVMSLGLSSEDIAELETRTEGWIAGLHLAAISMRGSKDHTGFIKSFTGSHRLVLDYLIEEVLGQQPDDIQAFLLGTSILERLSGPLCDAVTGRRDGQATLEMLDQANLFIIPLDDERQWYRYHHLFADLLRGRLHQTLPDQLSAAHDLASAWYEQNGLIDEAIDHALRAENFERAADLIERHIDGLWGRGEHIKIRRWMAGLPDWLIASRPELCILHAWNFFTSGQQETAEQFLQAAEMAFAANKDPDKNDFSRVEVQGPSDPYRMKISGRAATIRAFLAFYRGDVEEVNRYTQQALESLPEDDLVFRSTATVALGDAYSFSGDMSAAYQARLSALEANKAAGNAYMTMIACMKLAVTIRQQGELERVIEICQQYLRLAEDNGLSQTIVVGWLYSVWGEVLAEFNDLEQAANLAKRGVELVQRGRDLAMTGWSNLCLMRVLFSREELRAAQDVIQKMENLARENYVPPWIMSLVAAWQARVWLARGELEKASQWFSDRELDPDGELILQRELEYMAAARILAAQGHQDEALGLLQRLVEPAEKGGRTSRLIEILILHALALQARGETGLAVEKLERALVLGEPGGFIRIFLDEGPLMEDLLVKAFESGAAPDYVRRLLGAFSSPEIDRSDLLTSQMPDQGFVEPLSERELEVLQLIAEGLTNPEIAGRLYLSLNTVKVHTRNIYGKMGVNNRTQAVNTGRSSGILSDT